MTTEAPAPVEDGANEGGSSEGFEAFDSRRLAEGGQDEVSTDPAEPESGDDKRSDFTIKATRRPAPPPPSPPKAQALTRSNSTPAKSSPPRVRHAHTSSTSSITMSNSHAHIPDPDYLVRSQFGLHRSSSQTSMNEQPLEPTISGGLARRMSLSSSEGEDNGDEEHEDVMAKVGKNRPTKHRSDSLPIFPPPEATPRPEKKRGGISLADLPTNPKLWLPSHLAIYISHVLDLHPLLEQDITAFIRDSRLSGRAFLRLRDDDMESMGINVRWRPLLSDARDRLRREALGGKIWGFEGVRYGDNEGWESDGGKGELYATDEEGEEEGERREGWTKSWRKTQGGRQTGRVKDMAMAFEAPAPTTEPLPKSTSTSSLRSINSGGAGPGGKRTSIVFPASASSSHLRSDSLASTGSAASIDSGRGNSDPSDEDKDTVSPFDFDTDTTRAFDVASSPNSSLHASPPQVYQANMSSHLESSDFSPYKLVRRPSARRSESSGGGVGANVNCTMVGGPGSRMSVHELAMEMGVGHLMPEQEEEDEKDGGERYEGPPTVKSTSSAGGKGARREKSSLEALFGIDTSRPKSEEGKSLGVVMSPDQDDDLMGMQVGGAGGSMIFVKKSQLDALQKKLEDVEAKLAIALAEGGPAAPSSSHPDSGVPQAPANLGSWILSSFSQSSSNPNDDPEDRIEEASGPLSWTALGGYCIAASIGIGIVAGEVVVSKLFGVGRRR